MADAGIGIADTLLLIAPSVCDCCQSMRLGVGIRSPFLAPSYLAWPAHREHASILRHDGRNVFLNLMPE